MPSKQGAPVLTASVRGFNFLESWTYRYAPFRGLVRLGVNTTGAVRTVDMEVKVGSDSVVDRGPVSVGATAGVMPAPLNVPYHEFIVNPGDLIQPLIDELAAATPTLNYFVVIDPI